MKKPLLLFILFYGGIAMALNLTSPAFKSGEPLPTLYSCDGKDVSPPLAWQGAPQNTQSYVLIVDDPDAPSGVWDHWLVVNIPATTTSLTEGAVLPTGTLVLKNSWSKAHYNGPCPPKGQEHRYVFTLYALDSMLNLSKEATKKELIAAIKNHVLAKAELRGVYKH